MSDSLIFISPNKDFANNITNLPIGVLDVAYFPSERGIYNFNPNLSADGLLVNPKTNFGAITRAILADTDFDNANVEQIEFWLMNPFVDGETGKIRDGIFNKNNTKGGKEFAFELGTGDAIRRSGLIQATLYESAGKTAKQAGYFDAAGKLAMAATSYGKIGGAEGGGGFGGTGGSEGSLTWGD